MAKFSIKKTVSIIAVIGLLIFLHFTKILSPIENAIVFVLDPLGGKIYSISSNIKSAYLNRKENKNLANEITILEQQLAELTAEKVRLRMIEEENIYLREQLKFFERNEYDHVLVNVISRGGLLNVQEQEKTVIIDKGSQDGIYPGLVLVDGNGVVIGKVLNTKEKISEVLLTTDPLCKLAVSTATPNQATGLTEGDLGLTINMNYIPQDDVIQKNDIVVTSGLEENIPKGLMVGRVIQVSKQSNEVWQSAVVEPLAEVESVDIASVIIP